MFKAFIIIVSLSVLAVPAHAKPDCVKSHIKASRPYGTATLKKLFFHVYDAEFWTDGKGWKADKPYALHLTYGVSIDKEDFLDRTLKELKRQPELDKKILRAFENKLAGIYPDVKKGDSITARYEVQKGIHFCHNGKPIGSIMDVKLVHPFFAIWLGEHTSEATLRDKLLKK